MYIYFLVCLFVLFCFGLCRFCCVCLLAVVLPFIVICLLCFVLIVLLCFDLFRFAVFACLFVFELMFASKRIA